MQISFIVSFLFVSSSLHVSAIPIPSPQAAEIVGDVIKGIGSIASGGGGLASAFSSLFGDIGQHVGGKAANILGKISNVFGKIGEVAEISGGIASKIVGKATPNLINLEAKAAPTLFNSISQSARNLVERPIASMTAEGLIQRSGEILRLLEGRTKSASAAAAI